MIKKIMLIMPPNTMPLNNKAKRAVQPIGLAYIAAVLEKNDFKVNILDAGVEGWDQEIIDGDYITYGLTFDQIAKKIKEFSPDMIGVSCAFSPQINNAHKTCTAAKQVSKNIITIIGGLHPSVFPEETLKNKDVDFVIMAEGEYRILNLIKKLNNKKNLKNIDGLAYRKNEKIIIQNQTTFIENLDDIPFPARHLLDLEKYFKINMPFNPFPKGKRVIQMLTSRGCPVGCVFCASCNFWGKRFRMRSAENVLEEMKYLKEEYNVEEIQFADDNMTLNRERMVKIFEGLKKIKIPYLSTPGGLYVNSLDEELIKLMKEAGFYQLTLAIESGDTYVNKNIIGKNVDLEKAKRLVKYAHKLNIGVHGFFVYGLPGETKEQIKKTFKYAKELDVDSVSYYIAQPIPGSELYNIYIREGHLKYEDYKDMDLKSGTINLSEMDSKELEIWVSEETAKLTRIYLIKHPIKFFKKYGNYILTNRDSNSNMITNFIAILHSFKKSKIK